MGILSLPACLRQHLNVIQSYIAVTFSVRFYCAQDRKTWPLAFTVRQCCALYQLKKSSKECVLCFVWPLQKRRCFVCVSLTFVIRFLWFVFVYCVLKQHVSVPGTGCMHDVSFALGVKHLLKSLTRIANSVHWDPGVSREPV